MNTDHATELHPILGIPWQKMPRHIAIIMDGNGRWAQEQGLPRVHGHRKGGKSVRKIVTESARLGIECLTLYSFSTENWKRPKEEIDALMDLYADYLIGERPTIMNNNIKVRHLGNEEELPPHVIDELRETVRLSQNNTGMTLCLALNYSGRSELVHAIRNIAHTAKEGSLDPDAIDEKFISSQLYTKNLPDPDLLIRTAAENRISNFLLWQISYAELYVTDVYWPDFDEEVLHQSILTYSKRNRRFGGLKPANF
jgi:undecaprenyl diphosphate synthase